MPVGVTVCVCVPSAEPVKVSAGTVCVCVARADPVKVSAGIVIEGELDAAAALFRVEKTYFVGLVTGTSVDAEVIVVDALVPAGVPALVAPVAECVEAATRLAAFVRNR